MTEPNPTLTKQQKYERALLYHPVDKNQHLLDKNRQKKEQSFLLSEISNSKTKKSPNKIETKISRYIKAFE